MLNLGRRDGLLDPKTAQKLPLATAPYGTPNVATRPGTATRSPPLPAIPTLDSPVAPVAPARDLSAPAAAPAETAGSKLSVGPNIELKGAEISDCAILVVEGHMEATVNSTAMEIAQTGTLKGLALIDVAEIHGEFSGELTARKKLVVHGTGRVTGTIRYGKLVVVEGGELTGDVKRLDPSMEPERVSPARIGDSSAQSIPPPKS
jgi:cytoskeletal protein CcmA (bactofilin family)